MDKLRKRLEVIDLHAAVSELGLDEPNIKLLIKKIVKSKDVELCIALENAAHAFKMNVSEVQEEEALKKAAAEARLAALGLTREDLELIMKG